eukprot:1179846-Prorocentrum_minimum.AAC.2
MIGLVSLKGSRPYGSVLFKDLKRRLWVRKKADPVATAPSRTPRFGQFGSGHRSENPSGVSSRSSALSKRRVAGSLARSSGREPPRFLNRLEGWMHRSKLLNDR